jgi:hypothetical protein
MKFKIGDFIKFKGDNRIARIESYSRGWAGDLAYNIKWPWCGEDDTPEQSRVYVHPGDEQMELLDEEMVRILYGKEPRRSF